MWEASESRDIAATPEAVWSVISDFGRHPALAGSGEVLAVRTSGAVGVGSVFEGDVRTGEVGSFVSRNVVTAFDHDRRLAWSSYPPLDDDETPAHQIEVQWAFDLVPSAQGTRVTHSFRVDPPAAGAAELGAFLERTDRIATVKVGMTQTLDNLAAAVERG